MLTTPRVARCQALLGSISATATLKRVRRPSFTLRTTCRLSFSDWAPSIRISSVRYAIMLCAETKSRKLASLTSATPGPGCQLEMSSPRAGRGTNRDRSLRQHPHLRPITACGEEVLSERFRRYPLDHERLDDVAGLDVTVVGDANAAFHAVAHFAGIIFEAPQRAHLALEHDHIVAQQSHFGIALDKAIDHVAASDRAHLGDAEGLADRGASLVGLLEDRFQQARHGALHFILQLVDDGVQANVHLLLFGQLLRLTFRAHVEPDDDGI